MPRNKLPQEEKKVRWKTLYIEPKLLPYMDENDFNKEIKRIQSEALDKCVAENLKKK